MIIITIWQSTKKWSTPSIYWVIKGRCWWSDLRGRSVGRQHVTSSHVLALLSNPHLGSMELWDLDDASALISMPLCCFMRARNNFIVPCHVIVYRGAGTMAPSVDKSVVVLCRDDVGLWAHLGDNSAANRSSSGPCQAQCFLPWIRVNNLSRRAQNRDDLLTAQMWKLPEMLRKGSLDLQKQEKRLKKCL